MNFKQIIGILLMILMMVLSYSLFGGVAHEKQPLPVKVNTTGNESVIQEYHYYTLEENATVDISFIAIMLLLIGITSVGSVANADGKDGKDDDEPTKD